MTVTMMYAGSDPALVSNKNLPTTGAMRLWTSESSRTWRHVDNRDLNNPADNSLGFYVDGSSAGISYTGDGLRKLGFSDTVRTITLYVEAVRSVLSTTASQIVASIANAGTTSYVFLANPQVLQAAPGYESDAMAAAPGGMAFGADGGDPVSLMHTGPVRYFDGTVDYTSTDLDP